MTGRFVPRSRVAPVTGSSDLGPVNILARSARSVDEVVAEVGGGCNKQAG